MLYTEKNDTQNSYSPRQEENYNQSSLFSLGSLFGRSIRKQSIFNDLHKLITNLFHLIESELKKINSNFRELKIKPNLNDPDILKQEIAKAENEHIQAEKGFNYISCTKMKGSIILIGDKIKEINDFLTKLHKEKILPIEDFEIFSGEYQKIVGLFSEKETLFSPQKNPEQEGTYKAFSLTSNDVKTHFNEIFRDITDFYNKTKAIEIKDDSKKAEFATHLRNFTKQVRTEKAKYQSTSSDAYLNNLSQDVEKASKYLNELKALISSE